MPSGESTDTSNLLIILAFRQKLHIVLKRHVAYTTGVELKRQMSFICFSGKEDRV